MRAHTRSGALIACAATLLATAPVGAATLQGNAALTSDYVWRGSTQTRGEPALQAGLRLATDSGLYLSAWGSNVRFAPQLDANREYDFSVGWSAAIADAWTLDVNVLRYRYPSTTVDLDWTEANATLGWRDTWLSVGYSPQALGSDGSGVYAQFGARHRLGDRFRLEGAVARYFLESAYGRSYSHVQAAAVYAFDVPRDRSLELRLTAHATDHDARRILGDDVTGSRLELALQAGF